MGTAHRLGSGDVGTVVVVSAKREQARERIQTIRRGLEVLGIRHKPHYETIEVLDADGDVVIRVSAFTATVAGVVSQSTVLAFCDELALWRVGDTTDNPAKEVLDSLTPSLEEDATLWLVSAPWTEDDEHAKAFDAAGEHDSDDPIRFYAPTWEANPSRTEENTRLRCPDEVEWTRAYKAIPMSGGESSLFDRAAIDRAFGIAAEESAA